MSGRCYLHEHIRIRISCFMEIYDDHKELFKEAGLSLDAIQYFYLYNDVYHYVHKKMPNGYYAIYIREVEVIIPPRYIESVANFDNSKIPQVGYVLKGTDDNGSLTYNKILGYYMYRNFTKHEVSYVCTEFSTMKVHIVSEYDDVIAPDDFAMLEVLKHEEKQKRMLDDYARGVMAAWRQNQGINL